MASVSGWEDNYDISIFNQYDTASNFQSPVQCPGPYAKPSPRSITHNTQLPHPHKGTDPLAAPHLPLLHIPL